MPTLQIQRLNMDTSWYIRWNDTALLLDPWLIGSEVDGFSWFNEQWHTTTPVALEDLPPYDHILVSQSYSDHCHEPTLKTLQPVPLYVPPTAAKRLSKQGFEVLPIHPLGQPTDLGDLQVSYLDPERKMDPIYYGIVLTLGDEAIVYAPHGFTIEEKHLKALEDYNVQLLITTFSLYQLPGLLGGKVNPGLESAKILVERLQPRHVVQSHDEQKEAKGLIDKLARKTYPERALLESTFPEQFVYLDERYDLVTLG